MIFVVVSHFKHRVIATAIALAATCFAGPLAASAQDIPWRQQQFDLRADNEPLNAFLARILTLNGVASLLSAPIAEAKVNGHLRGSAETIFREVADTYGLTWYFDGSVLYVYSLGELESRLLQVHPADVPRIERTLRDMGLEDNRFPLRVSLAEGQVLVSGPPRYVQIVGSIATRVADAPSQGAQQLDTRVFRLRYARAADSVVNIAGTETTIPGIAKILNETLGADNTGAAPANAGTRAMPVAVPGLRGKGQIAIGHADAVAPSAPASTAPAGLASEPAPFTGAVARADPRINAVIIRDTQERMPMYERLIADLDVSTPLLEIEATVIDISHDKSEALGIDWRLHSRRAGTVTSPDALAGTTRPDENGFLYADPLLSSGGGLVGTLLFGSERNNFLARLNALTASGDANLISKPRVLTLDNTEAVLQSTRDFYVRVAGREQVDLFNVSLGLVLRVTPTLIEDALGPQVKLTIRIEDGNTDSGTQVDQIPVVNRNAISTQAVVGDGTSLLIGGYIVEQKTQDRSGVPFLSDVPGLRWLFGQRASSSKRMERIFMITPRWVKPEETRSEAPAPATSSDTPTAGELQ